jgi:flagellar hook protein FlgE
MSFALSAAVTGMQAHQKMLDVAGNNLANLNTNGYKSSSISFSEMLSQTLKRASQPTETTGGTNPQQMGSGVQISAITRNMSQGNIETTGQALDMAIEGEGFFVLNDGEKNVYSRVGSFAVDADSMLVDPSTGFRVQRTGIVGENESFQIPGDGTIKIPYDTLLPAKSTGSIVLTGNLSADTSEATKAVLTSGTDYRYTIDGAAASTSTLIADLDQFSGTLGAGDEIEIAGTSHDGSAVSTTLAVEATTTAGDLIDLISSVFTGSTATFVDGQIILADDAAGYSKTDISLTYTGTAELTTPGYFQLTTAGGNTMKSIDTTIYDALGGTHVMTAALVKTDTANEWDLVITSVSGDVLSIEDRRVEGITFNPDGGYIGLTGSVDYTLGVIFTHDPTRTQDITASLGTAGKYDGITQFGGSSTAVITSQDGYESGKLSSLGVDNMGIVIGTFTNGQKLEIASIAVGLFRNPAGLESVGNGYYVPTANTGDAVIVQATSGGSGTIHGGSLEKSNVDVANEFVQMIQAQNGFQANARTISVANDVLRELSTLIR